MNRRVILEESEACRSLYERPRIFRLVVLIRFRRFRGVLDDCEPDTSGFGLYRKESRFAILKRGSEVSVDEDVIEGLLLSED